jgi:hypothetical protein
MADYSDAYKGQPSPTWEDVDKAFTRGYNSGYKAGYANAVIERVEVPTPQIPPRCPTCEGLIFEDQPHAH